ncbi:kinesin-like protein KIN-4C [Tanacetum coccineum]
MQTIFRHVEAMKGNTEYLIRVSFIEIFKEEIRETVNGGISLAGVIEAEVTSQEEMVSFLLRGSVCRATGSTNMNSQSSRSHAIFTISMEQKRIAGVTSGGVHDDIEDDILSTKLL